MKRRLVYTIIIITLTIILNIGIFYLVYKYDQNAGLGTRIYYTIRVFGIIIVVLVSMSVILGPKYSYNKAIWLMLLYISPAAGLLFYFVFAREFKTKSIEVDRPLIRDNEYLKYEPYSNQTIDNEIFSFLHKNSGKSVFKDNTRTTILTNGDELFPKLLETLKDAKNSIYMSYYIIQDDDLANSVLEILKEKALEGIEVKLLFDALGGKNIKRKKIKELKLAGVQVAIFERLTFYHFFNALNFRYHRKITIVDGKYGFIGGLNLGKEYNHQSKKFGFWRDTHLMMEGEGIISLTNIFSKDWYYTTGFWPTPKYHYEELVEPGLVASVESGADHDDSIIKETYFKMITKAKKSIYITTPYLMLETDLERALISASKSGVDVRIMLPGKADKFIINQATKSYYQTLLENNIKIYEYKNTFVHAKVLIVDEDIASIGTVNFDPRSFNINFEATVFIQNDPKNQNSSVNHLIKDFNNDIANAVEIDLKTWKKRSIISRLIQGLVGLLSPLI